MTTAQYDPAKVTSALPDPDTRKTFDLVLAALEWEHDARVRQWTQHNRDLCGVCSIIRKAKASLE